MKKRTILIQLVIFVIGASVGYTTNGRFNDTKNKKNGADLRLTREGQTSFINPLLACDNSADPLTNSDMKVFKSEVERYLNSRSDRGNVTKVSVYFRELIDGQWFSIGDTEQFIPASLRKVPLMIALLKQGEAEKDLLERKVVLDLSVDENLKQNIKPSHPTLLGSTYTIRDLIFRMIVYSDNNAFFYLTRIVKPVELQKVYSTLRVLDRPQGASDNFMSVQTYESFFRVLYNATYLSRSSSSWALSIMSNSEFKTGIVAGVPPAVEVSHKFGEHSDAPGAPVQLHDCGIVYHPTHPYLICVMSHGPNYEFLSDVIAGVSKTIYGKVDSQSLIKTP